MFLENIRVKLKKVAEVKVVEVEEYPVIEQEEQWEQPLQSENLEIAITASSESYSIDNVA